MAIVTGPLKVAARLPSASSTVTCTAGWMVRRGNVVLGCTVNARCGGGLSVITLASHVLGELKFQVQCGSTEPTLDDTRYWPSSLIYASDPAPPMLVKPDGGSVGTTPSDIVTAYASAPAPMATAPGAATVGVDPEPEADP